MTKQIVNPSFLITVARGDVLLRDVVNRGTGKTTAAILRAIADAHAAPGERVVIADEDVFDDATLWADPQRARFTADAARDIITKLGLVRVEVTTSPYDGMPAIISNFAVVI